MSDGTKIEWTDATWNIVTGCSVVSPGCTNCYAMRLAGTRLRHHFSREGLTDASKAGPVWNGKTRVNWEWIDQPLNWGRPRSIFVCAHGDLFHDSVASHDIAQIYGVMIAAHHLRGHMFQVLTKRPARARALLTDAKFWEVANADAGALIMDRVDPLDRRLNDARATLDDYGPDAPPPGIWLGVSVEDQQRANERIPDLMATPASVRWLSCEPLLDFISLEEAWHGESALNSECWGDCGWCEAGHPPMWNCQREGRQFDLGALQRSGLDWVVAGGESGPNARPMDLEAARSLRDQCADAGVPFFFKQWGKWLPSGQMTADGKVWASDSGHALHAVKSMTGRYLDGQLHDALPQVTA
jgi:protein gp37